MGSIGCPETSVRNYYSLRNNLEERSSVPHTSSAFDAESFLLWQIDYRLSVITLVYNFVVYLSLSRRHKPRSGVCEVDYKY
jgi:hypothetical protein